GGPGGTWRVVDQGEGPAGWWTRGRDVQGGGPGGIWRVVDQEGPGGWWTRGDLEGGGPGGTWRVVDQEGPGGWWTRRDLEAVGIQMKLDFFKKKFWTASRQRHHMDVSGCPLMSSVFQCAAVDGRCSISCDDE
ncbi:hypothetical protein NHX12_012129, partial [Muraenolepis orangiensis]